ncbi:cupin domain-containing protein [Granulicatella sp. HMSC31F03]|uniref:cupin domain-containing protein n=1 Tax=Granulicatella sp. HMSC31F03 TaxID=1581074 RepID=UPI0008A27912|nr:cupin domain-containing protein [Granulicatella sp. HMSC31F03]OFS99838.1 cupin [Granulicatella sp. HMSC31F03]
MKTKEEWIEELALEPHVEGGYFRQTYKAVETVELPVGRIRSLSTSILFLLTNQNPSHFHLLSSDEIWYYHFGHALTVHMIHPNGTYEAVEIGPGEGQKLQFTVPAGVVFGSTIESDNEEDFAIVSCSVTPGFEYEDFILYTQDELLENYAEHEEIIRRLAVVSK